MGRREKEKRGRVRAGRRSHACTGHAYVHFLLAYTHARVRARNLNERASERASKRARMHARANMHADTDTLPAAKTGVRKLSNEKQRRESVG